MADNVLGIDEIDAQIIKLLMNDPNITQSKMAKQLDRSQPTIGIRMKSLEERGLVFHQYGVNGKVTDIFKVVKLEMTHNDPNNVMSLARHCPFMINAIKQSGKRNIMLLLASPGKTMRKINFIIDYHFRNKDYISNIKFEVITDFSSDFLIPIDIQPILDGLTSLVCNADCPCHTPDLEGI